MIQTMIQTMIQSKLQALPRDVKRLHLVRHGETDWNRDGRYQGLSDAPLNATGRAQARLLAARLLAEQLRGTPVDAVFASPLVRAFETAEILAEALGRSPVPVPDLRERDVGAWGGLTPDQIRARFPAEWELAQTGADLALGGGETKAAVLARMTSAVTAAAAAHPGGTVLVVGHGLALKLLVCHLLGLDVAQSDRLATMTNTGVTTFEVRRGLPRMTVYGDASHLDGVVLPR